MKRFNIENINNSIYWDTHQTATDFGLRQQKYLELAGTGHKILEIGCGLSPFLQEARKKFEFSVGYDFSDKTLSRARSLYPDVLYYKEDAKDLPDQYIKFDVVVAGEVIEHLEDPDKFIKDLERIGKRIIMSTPQLEFEDPEHLWEFDEEYFKSKGFTTEIIHSDRFKGRSYIFAYKDL